MQSPIVVDQRQRDDRVFLASDPIGHAEQLRALELTLPDFAYFHHAGRLRPHQAPRRGLASRPARCKTEFLGPASAPRPSRRLCRWGVAHQRVQARRGLRSALDGEHQRVARQRRFPHQISGKLIQAGRHMLARVSAAVDRSNARCQPFRPTLRRLRSARFAVLEFYGLQRVAIGLRDVAAIGEQSAAVAAVLMNLMLAVFVREVAQRLAGKQAHYYLGRVWRPDVHAAFGAWQLWPTFAAVLLKPMSASIAASWR